MSEVNELTIDHFLDRVSQRTPTPGGGGVTGLAGALACALGRMVGAYSIRKDSDAETREAADKAGDHLLRSDQILRALIDRDAVAYTKMADASKKRRAARGRDDDAEAAFQEAVIDATAVPMEMAAVASNALRAMDEFKTAANRHLLSDLAIAAVLADATARAARCTMWVNAPLIADAHRRNKIMTNMDRIMLHCAHHLTSVEAFVHRHVEENAAANR